jgi:hypothetical protein
VVVVGGEESRLLRLFPWRERVDSRIVVGVVMWFVTFGRWLILLSDAPSVICTEV